MTLVAKHLTPVKMHSPFLSLPSQRVLCWLCLLAGEAGTSPIALCIGTQSFSKSVKFTMLPQTQTHKKEREDCQGGIASDHSSEVACMQDAVLFSSHWLSAFTSSGYHRMQCVPCLLLPPLLSFLIGCEGGGTVTSHHGRRKDVDATAQFYGSWSSNGYH